MIVFDSFNLIAGNQIRSKAQRVWERKRCLKISGFFFQNCYTCLGPSIHGLVTDIQVNVNIGNTLSMLSFQS